MEGVDEGHGQRQPHAVGKEVTERSFIPLFRIMIMLATVCQEHAIRNHAIYSCHIEDRPLQFKLGCLVLSEKRCLVTFWHFFINYCCIHGPIDAQHACPCLCLSSSSGYMLALSESGIALAAKNCQGIY